MYELFTLLKILCTKTHVSLTADELFSQPGTVWNQIFLLTGEPLWFSLTMLPKTQRTNNEAAEAPDEINLR